MVVLNLSLVPKFTVKMFLSHREIVSMFLFLLPILWINAIIYMLHVHYLIIYNLQPITALSFQGYYTPVNLLNTSIRLYFISISYRKFLRNAKYWKSYEVTFEVNLSLFFAKKYFSSLKMEHMNAQPQDRVQPFISFVPHKRNNESNRWRHYGYS